MKKVILGLMVAGLVVGCGGGKSGTLDDSQQAGSTNTNVNSVSAVNIKGHKIEVPYVGDDIVMVEFFCDGGYSRIHSSYPDLPHHEYHESMTHISDNKLYLDELYEDIYGPGQDLLVTNADNVSIVDSAIVVGASRYYIKNIGEYDISKISKVNNCN